MANACSVSTAFLAIFFRMKRFFLYINYLLAPSPPEVLAVTWMGTKQM
jgi:hypothetical protein